MDGAGGQGWGDFGSNLKRILGGLFGDTGSPYEAFGNEFGKYINQGINYQNPFYNAGTGAIGNYQDWLSGMKDPSKYLNDLMGGYQESPWAKNLQDYSRRAGTAAASASGLIGSTPYMQSLEQNAANIGSMDMQNWLKNALGINESYGQGQQYLMGGGQNAANSIAEMLSKLGIGEGEAAAGQAQAQNQDWSNVLGGIINMVPSVIGMFL